MAYSVYNQRAWKIVRLVVLERDEWLCQIRGPKCTKRATCVDHIKPDWPDPFDVRNLRSSCKSCNSGRRPGMVTLHGTPEIVTAVVARRNPSRAW